MRSSQKRLLLVGLVGLLALAYLFPRFDRSNRTRIVAMPERHARAWPHGERMTPADASEAQTRTAALFESQLKATEKLLQCD